MKTIKVIRTGCTQCKKTEFVVREAVEKYDLNSEGPGQAAD